SIGAAKAGSGSRYRMPSRHEQMRVLIWWISRRIRPSEVAPIVTRSTNSVQLAAPHAYNRGMADRQRIGQTLEQLVLTAAVSGSEHRLRAVIERQLAASGIAAERIAHDRMGNLWLHCGPAGDPQRLLVAHMDEIGWRISS